MNASEAASLSVPETLPATAASPGQEPDPEVIRAHAERVALARARLTGLRIDDEKLEKARRRLAKAEGDYEQTLKEQRRLKWFFVPMLTTWPIGFLWHGWMALYIFLAWVTFWGVGSYLSWGHRRNAETRVLETKAEIQALTELLDEAGGPRALSS